jgi:two-component system response regulator YesN
MGEAEVWAGGAVHHLHEGGVLIIPTGTVHSAAAVHWFTDRPVAAYSRLLWIAVFPYGGVLNVCESSGGTHRSSPRRLIVDRRLNCHIQELLLEIKRGEELSRMLAACKLIEAMVWLSRGEEPSCTEDSFRQAQPPKTAVEHDSSLAGRTMAFIEQNFDAGIGLEDIAQAVCSSKSHLCREFKAGSGMTVIEYLTRVRVEASRRLLITGLPISRVSRMVGFEDPYYFSRVFRRVVGAPPIEFRRQQKPGALAQSH